MIDSIVNGMAMYVVCAYLFLQLPLKSPLHDIGLAILNIAFSIFCFFYDGGHIQYLPLATCACIILLSYGSLKVYAAVERCYWLALLMPICLLVLMKAGYLPAVVGISYLAFRLSYLAFEMHAGRITLPAVHNYYGFAFFPLTFLIGPISPYQLYEHSLRSPDRAVTPLPRSLTRILVGMIKVFYIAQLFKMLNFNGLWMDGYYHGIHDFIIACVCSYLFLYFNFSGACDMIIGAAGAMNIRVKENFANPLLARNIREFWSRFHVTLSDFIRDIVFTPGQLWLARILGRKWVHFATIVMIMVTFFFVGLWHGTGINFMILGFLYGIGMVVFYLYSLLWKKLPLTIQQVSNRWWMRSISTLLTFAYVSFASLFFENDWEKIKQIYSLFVWP